MDKLSYHVILLGANGFIGKQLLNSLKLNKISHSVVSRKISTSSLDYYNISSEDFFNGHFTQFFKPEIVVLINCIGEVKNINDMISANVEIVKKIISLNIRYKFKKVIQISSAGVYFRKGIIKFDSPLFPVNYYEWTKLMADELILNSDFNSNFQIIRPTTVISNDMRPIFLYKIVNLFKVIFPHYGPAKNKYFHFVSVKVVVETILKCIYDDYSENIILVSTDANQYVYKKNILNSKYSITFPSFFFEIINFLLSEKYKSKFAHLNDSSFFVSNITQLNQEEFVVDSLKDVFSSK